MNIPDPPVNLYKKMAKVMKNLKTVKKSGRNTYQGYQYATEADIIESVRHELVKENIFIFSSVEGVEREGDITTCKILHTFVDTDSGETFSVYSFGTGQDKGDKGLYKSFTGAFKYMLAKNLLIASEDDPEKADANPSYVKGSGKSSSAKAFTKAKPATTKPVAAMPTSEPEPVTPAGSTSKPSFSTMKSEDIPY